MRLRPDGADSSADRAWQNSRGLGSPRLRATAFTVSAVLHLIAILAYTTMMNVLRPDAAAFPIPSDTEAEQGIDVIRLVEIDEEDLERPEEPEELDEVVPPEADARPPRIPGPVVGELIPPGPTAAERLRPNRRSVRLWANLPDEFFELTLEEREEILLADRIVEWYDSLSAAQAAEDRLTDWTFRDREGGRWGVADGKIYLGDVALPLPLQFGIPVGKRDVTNYRIWEFEEIERQSQRFLIEQSWKERAAAIRARRDRERAAAIDTTRIR
ncbi:MAG: hypothetical protein OEN56_02025 [Gemmatimonadota bacterium]|nr:hypothetical protein [Gemmatimonadota bacterium]